MKKQLLKDRPKLDKPEQTTEGVCEVFPSIECEKYHGCHECPYYFQKPIKKMSYEETNGINYFDNK